MNFDDQTILITGAAGFIGYHLAHRILTECPAARVVGLDDMNDYYDVSLKQARLDDLNALRGRFTFIRGSIADRPLVDGLFAEHRPDVVVNLAAQAGVRYSITHPEAYIQSNLVGFFHILEACRHARDGGGRGVRHLVYASSSSVYGLNEKTPYSTEDKADRPVSLYAATKKSDELMAHAYSKLYGIPATGLRFFTVYGPMGRPDMAYFGFTDKMVRGEKIQLFNHGDMYRDFTYVDDVVTGVMNVMARAPEANADGVPYALYNIGNHHPESLLDFVQTLEECLLEAGVIDHPAEKELLPMQPGDVYQTCADVEPLARDFGFRPDTPLREGLRRYARWYREYYC
ncbi:MAG: GDP-mannose 4,6-dehydratase [Clostridia bacterium]|nr:GDP-mannose 4,6-dehydratase [Clostridia bacterium]